MPLYHYPDLARGGYAKLMAIQPGDFLKCSHCKRFHQALDEIWCGQGEGDGLWPICSACLAQDIWAVRKTLPSLAKGL